MRMLQARQIKNQVQACLHQPLGSLHRQRGLGLATAVFVITVMALLAVLINKMIGSSATATAEEINLIRSFYAAQSGAEYGLNRAFPPDGSAGLCPAVTNSSTTFLPANVTSPGLSECSMEIVCSTLIVSSATYYTISGKGTCGPISRTVQVRAK